MTHPKRRGRPARSASGPARLMLRLRVTEQEMTRYEAAAGGECTLSDWARRRLNEAAHWHDVTRARKL